MNHATYTLNIISMQPLCEHTTCIEAQIADPGFYYQAGQYVKVMRDDGVASPLSIACAPRDDHTIAFHLYHPPGNPRAQALFHAAVQTKQWLMRGPFGHCTVTRLHADQPILFIAYGTGFAPIKAVLEGLLATANPPRCCLYWVVADKPSFYAADLLARWASEFPSLTFYPILNHHFEDKAAVTRHLIETLWQHHQAFSPFQVYVSGPRPFAVELYAWLNQHGLSGDNFYSDVYP